ncbi:MAG: protein kinase domain-containing protein [Verrucomicrobiales bacterium]
MTEREIFFEALEMATPEARAAYLLGACGRDVTLRRKVDELLKEHFSNDSLLAGPALEGERPAANESPVQEAPARMIGRYKLLEKLGEGGFGEVWMAEQREPVKRRVALKIIKPGMDSRQIVARFEAERQALAMMDHANIARIFDADVTDTGRPYFVMELVRGIKITEYCDQNQLPTQERLRLFILVCQAIQHAHHKGIIHRDLKPSNILVTLYDGVPVPKVIDFGIAKATQLELTDKTVFTQFQQFIGTPAYISPEQAEMSGLDIDTRADIYSLGVLLYELLVGQTPFDAKEMMKGGLDALRRIIREKEPLRPSTKLNTLPGDARTTAGKCRQTDVSRVVHQLQGDLDWIVMKCLEKDRTRRYDTANGLAADIQRHLNNEPVVARPASTAYRLQKAWRRNKLVYSAGVAVFLALAAGLALAATGWIQTRTQRDAAVLARAGEERQREQAQANEERAVQERQRAELAREETRRRAYAAEISAAFQALDENNLARAIDLLNRQRPMSKGEEDLRGFEWRLLWQRCQPDEKEPLPEGGQGGIAFSPDGKWLAHADSNIVIRELPSQSVVHTIPQGASTPPGASTLAFSPNGKLLAFGNHTNVMLWKTGSWEVDQILPRTRFAAVFSPDGQWLVTGVPGPETNSLGGYRVWNTETWQPGRMFGSELERIWVASRAVAFSPDGKLLVTAGHSDGRMSGNQFQVWDFPSLTLRTNFERFPGRLASAAFAPDGKHLLTGTGEHMLLVWNVAEGRIVERLDEHTGWISTITCGRDGRTFATASSDRTLVLWDAATREVLVRLRGHLGEVWSVALSPDGRMLASGARDGTTKLWDATTRHQQRELPDCHVVAGFSSDSRRLVGVGYRASRLWNLEAGAMTTIPLQDYDKLRDRSYFRSTCASEDAQGMEPKAVYGRTNGVLEIWNLATMSRVTSWRVHEGIVATAAFSPDGQFIATSGANGDVILWEAGTHRQVRRFDRLGGTLLGFRFSPDGRLLAGSEDKDRVDSRVGLWDVNSGALLRTLNLPGHIAFSLAFSPDDKLLATAEQNETAQLWDIPSGALRATLLGHVQPVVSVAFSPDGKTLATASDDGKVKLWNVTTEQEVATLELPGGCRSVKFSPDGRTLAVGYLIEPNEYIRLWEVPSFEEIDAAEAKERTGIRQR